MAGGFSASAAISSGCASSPPRSTMSRSSGRGRNRRLLEWLLELSDSLLTYRVRHMQHPEWPSVVDLLLFDERNPAVGAVPARPSSPSTSGCCPTRICIDVLQRRRSLLDDAVPSRRRAGRAVRPTSTASSMRCSSGCVSSVSMRLRIGAVPPLLQPCPRSCPRSDGRHDDRRRRSRYRIEHETRYRPRRRRVDVAARRLSHAAHSAAAARASGTSSTSSPRRRTGRTASITSATPSTQFTILTPYDELRVVSRSLVEVLGAPSARSIRERARRGRRCATSSPTRGARRTRNAVGVQLSVAVHRGRRRSWRRSRASRSRRAGRSLPRPSI